MGLCSSHSTVVKGILLDNGIKAELMDVGGRHVVVRAQLSDTAAYILDPDFGYYIPHDTAAITANPELARAAVRRHGKPVLQGGERPLHRRFNDGDIW